MPKLQSLFLIGHAHPALPGHFPHAAIVPGVMVLDQVLTRLSEHLGFDPVLLELPQVKFIEPLLPGSVAAIEIEANVIDGPHQSGPRLKVCLQVLDF